MALIKCTECGNKISTTANACPKCGAVVTAEMRHPKPKPTSIVTLFIAGLLGASALLGVFMSMGQRREAENAAAAEQARLAALTPEQRAKEAKARAAQQAMQSKREAEQNKQLTRTGTAASRLRKAAKDPSSFLLTEAFGGQNGVGCMEYRAMNSFGAILPGSAVVTTNGSILTQERDGNAFVAMWNKSCAKGGPDYKVPIDMVLRRE